MQTAHPRRWAALAVIALAQFMVIMDTSIIGVALPEIQADVGFTPDSLSWVFNAYVIAFGGLLLLGGRLSDLFGAKRIFSLGWLVLAAGSLAAGLAGATGVEIAARAVQGAGAALIAPSALTLLDDHERHINPRDLTRPASFRTGWSVNEIVRTFETGLNGTPMPSYGDSMNAQEKYDLAAYVMSLAGPGAGDQKRQVARGMEGLGTPARVIQLREHAFHLPDQLALLLDQGPLLGIQHRIDGPPSLPQGRAF